MNQQRFDYLLQRYKADMLTGSEEEEWYLLLETNEYDDLVRTDIENTVRRSLADDHGRAETVEADATWNKILSARETSSTLRVLPNDPPGQSPQGRRVKSITLLLVAAASLTVLVIGGVWFYSARVRQEGKYEVAAVAERGQKQIVLTDGTKVLLNASSSLQYPADFGTGAREVVLRGEAYFEITRDSHSPFTVRAGKMDIEALGTSFNVDAYDDAAGEHTALLEGTIRVSSEGDTILLQPGQEVYRDAASHKLAVRTFDPAKVLSWKSNKFSFDNTPLPAAALQLEKWYGVQVKCSGNADTLHVSGFVSRDQSLEELLKMLKYTSGVDYSREGNVVVLSGPAK